MSKFFFAFVYCPFTQHTKSSRKNLSLNKLTVQSVRLQRVSQLREANQKKSYLAGGLLRDRGDDSDGGQEWGREDIL